MTKKIFSLVLLFLSFSFSMFAEIRTTLLFDIALVDDERYKGPNPPAEIGIGIEITKDAYYKLSTDKDVIKGGLLKKGFNIINIKANHLFEKSGSYIYLLDLKFNDLILKKEIEIDIRLDSEVNVKKTEDKPQDIEYGLSLFIRDELIASSKKMHYEKFPLNIKLPPLPKNYRPFNPNARTDPIANSFSILSAVALAYELIKGIKNKRKAKKQAFTIQKKKQIIATFMRKNLAGVGKEVKAVILLSIKD